MTKPVVYSIKGVMIPGGLTISQRQTYIMGLRVSPQYALPLAIQDRASSMLGVIKLRAEQSGDAAMVTFIATQIEKWNEDCGEVFGK